MRLPDRRPTILLYPQGACTHTTLQRSSLPPISNGLLRNPVVTSQDSVYHGNSTQKPACIPYVQLRNAKSEICSHNAAMLAHVVCAVNEVGVIFQVQVRAPWCTRLLTSFRCKARSVIQHRGHMRRSTSGVNAENACLICAQHDLGEPRDSG